jgi:hypothetical protein
MPPEDRAPKIVLELAASVSGVPLRWYEYDDKWVILMTDGRKVHFKKKDPELPRRRETTDSYKPGVHRTNTRPDGSPRLAKKPSEE